MFVKELEKCPEFVAGDNSLLRELLHPKKDPVFIRYSLAYVKVLPGKTTLSHTLEYSEVYHILQGQGIIHIDNETKRVKLGDTIYIPPGAAQYIEVLGNKELSFLCIVDPAWEQEIEKIINPNNA